MRRFRDIKRDARRTLHAHLAEPAWYFPAADETPVPVTVRLHLRFDAQGELEKGFAERQEMVPRIVFLGSEVTPERNGYVVTQDMGAFKVDYDMPPDDITVTVEVAPVSRDKAIGFGWDPSLPFMGLATPVTQG